LARLLLGLITGQHFSPAYQNPGINTQDPANEAEYCDSPNAKTGATGHRATATIFDPITGRQLIKPHSYIFQTCGSWPG
jgi:hypothetical protein